MAQSQFFFQPWQKLTQGGCFRPLNRNLTSITRMGRRLHDITTISGRGQELCCRNMNLKFS